MIDDVGGAFDEVLNDTSFTYRCIAKKDDFVSIYYYWERHPGILNSSSADCYEDLFIISIS